MMRIAFLLTALLTYLAIAHFSAPSPDGLCIEPNGSVRVHHHNHE